MDMDSYDHLYPFVEVIVKTRKNRGLTQAELAAAAGISRRAIVMIEGGGDCTLSTVRRLHAVLDIHMKPTHASRPTLDDMDEQNSRDMFGGPSP